MKVYLSADIEGITGIAHWNETEEKSGDSKYNYFREQMTREVKAACEGALNAGASEIWVKDAHGSARNINPYELPKEVKFIREWSGHPFLMMQEIDESFDAAIMIGYHSYAGSNGNPMSHTLNSEKINYIKINDEYASEFMINAYTAAYVNVPVVFISGDEEICNHAESINSNLRTLAVNRGVGNSVISIHPELAIEKIKKEVEEILKSNIPECSIALPDKFKVEINYMYHYTAYKASFYPGVKLISPSTVVFETDNYFDVLRTFMFIA